MKKNVKDGLFTQVLDTFIRSGCRIDNLPTPPLPSTTILYSRIVLTVCTNIHNKDEFTLNFTWIIITTNKNVQFLNRDAHQKSGKKIYYFNDIKFKLSGCIQEI